MTLYHYTCAHRAALIGRRGLLVPYPQPVLHGRELLWLTDLAEPDVNGLGLTSELLSCDRTECRYEVVDVLDALVWPWREFALRYVQGHARMTLDYGGRPLSWFVTTSPVEAVRS